MGGRKWTLETRFGGPQMNPVAYIYIYISRRVDGRDILTVCTTGRVLHKKRVKQRDARPLNNGMRPVSLYKNSGFGRFFGGSN